MGEGSLSDDDDDDSGDEEQTDYNFKLIKPNHKKVNLRRINQACLKNTKRYNERETLGPLGIKSNKFWVDLGRQITYNPKDLFMSENFVFCTKAEIPLVAAFMTLDLIADPYEIKEEGKEVTLKVLSNSIVF